MAKEKSKRENILFMEATDAVLVRFVVVEVRERILIAEVQVARARAIELRRGPIAAVRTLVDQRTAIATTSGRKL